MKGEVKLGIKITSLCLFFLFMGIVNGKAQNILRVSGKIRALVPLEIMLKTLDGEKLSAVKLKKDGSFKMKLRDFVPDVYRLCLGKIDYLFYFSNSEVKIKGFYDYQNEKNSSFSFWGLDDHDTLMAWYPQNPYSMNCQVDSTIKGKLQGNMYSALAYIAAMKNYEPNKFLLDCMTPEAQATRSGQWLKRRVDSLYAYSIGVKAYNFTFQDVNDKDVSLSDFRGKIVLLDFCASWCGPCRQEMKNLLPIYQDLKGEDLEFISVSLDSKKENWKKMLEEEQLPWVMLWDSEGFVIGDEPNNIQRAYGFYSIPFIVLIDKEGKVLGRDLRGEKVREAILKARNN